MLRSRFYLISDKISKRINSRKFIFEKSKVFKKCEIARFSTSSVCNVEFFDNVSDAIKDIKDNSKLLIGGFGLCGTPENTINALVEANIQNLTVVGNSPGTEDFGIGLLLHKNQIKRITASYVGDNKLFMKQYISGQLEVELVPKGTLAERIRAGGAGIPAFYTPAGTGTLLQDGGVPVKYDENGSVVSVSDPKESRVFDGREYLLEEAITGDFSLIKAWKADKAGNLIFRLTANNFNQCMAKASKVTIAEVEEIVEVGELPPDHIHVPNIYVQRVFKGQSFIKKIEKVRTRPSGKTHKQTPTPAQVLREKIIRRAALEFKDGMFVNLGIGLPVLASNFIPQNMKVYLQGENGILGVGPYPLEDDVDADLINAGKETVTCIPGASTFAIEEAFAMIRGGHLQLTMLGAMQVSQNGDLANWMVPGSLAKGMGGAMDLVKATEKTKVIITMEHTTKTGEPKIVSNCSLPVTGMNCVDLIITEKGVFEVDKENGSLTLIELAEDVKLEDVVLTTGCSFKVADNLKPMKQIQLDW